MVGLVNNKVEPDRLSGGGVRMVRANTNRQSCFLFEHVVDVVAVKLPQMIFEIHPVICSVFRRAKRYGDNHQTIFLDAAFDLLQFSNGVDAVFQDVHANRGIIYFVA